MFIMFIRLLLLLLLLFFLNKWQCPQFFVQFQDHSLLKAHFSPISLSGTRVTRHLRRSSPRMPQTLVRRGHPVLVHTVLGRRCSGHGTSGMYSQWHTVCAVSNRSAQPSHQVLMWWMVLPFPDILEETGNEQGGADVDEVDDVDG